VAPETDFGKGLELEMPTSPPVSLHHLTGTPEPLGLFGGVPGLFGGVPGLFGGVPGLFGGVPGLFGGVPGLSGGVPGSGDHTPLPQAAERDWEEKRAALTQYSAKDINRLLEETQAELMKAIPDLEFAAKHKPTPSAASTPEHKPSKAQHAPKSGGKGDPNGRRGSDELAVPRYRTEKPSKSPPPPPPRRSFPSAHGLTTTRSGEVIVTSKKEPGFMKVARPASTPPIIASAVKDDDDEDRIIAELEVFQRSSASPPLPLEAVSPGHAGCWPSGAAVAAAQGRKPLAAPASRAFSLPQIVLTEWVSEPPSPEAEPELWLPPEGTSSSPKSPPAPRPAPGSASREFPSAAPPFPRDKTGGQGGSDNICPQISVAAPPPQSRGEGEGAGIVPEIPDEDPQKGAGLVPGHSTAPEGWDGGSPAAGEVTEGLCTPRVSPERHAAPGKKEIYEDTYQRLDSLEETIRELEMTISEISSHPAVEFVLSKDSPGSEEVGRSSGDLGHGDTALDLSRAKDGAAGSPVPSRTKPALLPKPQLPPGARQSGGVSIPAMKVVNPASRLKQGQQGSPDKGKHIKQRMEYMRIQGQQQVLRP
ncbi:SRCN1 inhibitor, partial [Oenanthe oenanthe]|nr:SRCN1 inhibitor [Oenanthe oenanthe]